MPRTDPLCEVRSFARLLSVGTVVGLGGWLGCVGDGLFARAVLIGFIPAGGVAWFFAGWWARAALRPIPSTVERGMVVGFVIGAVASIGFGLEFASEAVLREACGEPSPMDVVTTYVRVVGLVAAIGAAPGTVLGSLFGLVVQVRAGRVLRRAKADDRIRITSSSPSDVRPH